MREQLHTIGGSTVYRHGRCLALRIRQLPYQLLLTRYQKFWRLLLLSRSSFL